MSSNFDNSIPATKFHVVPEPVGTWRTATCATEYATDENGAGADCEILAAVVATVIVFDFAGRDSLALSGRFCPF